VPRRVVLDFWRTFHIGWPTGQWVCHVLPARRRMASDVYYACSGTVWWLVPDELAVQEDERRVVTIRRILALAASCMHVQVCSRAGRAQTND
jgi:hypothetical protein